MRSLFDQITNRDLLEEKDAIIREQSDAIEGFQKRIEGFHKDLEEFDERVAKFMRERGHVKPESNVGSDEKKN